MRGKIWISLFAACLILPAAAFGQNTQVSGTITDPNGIPYAFATVKAQLSAGPATVTITNQQQCISAGAGSAPCQLPIPGTYGPANADNTGHFSMALYDNSLITPGGTQYIFTVSISPGVLPPWGTGQQSFQVTTSVSGPTVDVGGFFSSLAPALTTVPPGGGSSPTYVDCSQEPGAPDMGLQINNCLAVIAAAGGLGVANAYHFSPSQTLTTPVVNSISAAILSCGVFITQIGNVSMTGTESTWQGCPQAITTLDKAANIDQVTLSGAGTGVIGLNLSGEKASFTGNGIVTASGASNVNITNNTISNEANDCLLDGAGAGGNFINSNTCTSWGNHFYESTSASPQSLVTNNFAEGDGTGTGPAVLNAGSSSITDNYIKDFNATVLVEDSTAAQQHMINANRLFQLNGWPGLNSGQNTTATANHISAGGVNGAAVTGAGVISGNQIVVTNGHGIVTGGGLATVSGNFISMGITGISGLCGLNAAGDQIGQHFIGNIINIFVATADTDYGECDTPTGVHNLDILFDGNMISGLNGGGATIIGHWTNNTAGLNTNWSLTVSNLGCLHVTTCLKRTDAQNNTSIYQNIQMGDATLDSGTGSTADVFIQNAGMAFANLPTPAGTGSIIPCSNCEPLSIAAAGGLGATLMRTNTEVNGANQTNWTGNQAVVGQDTHTAEITGNYGPVILIPGASPSGSYLVTIYTEVSTSVATSTITAGIAYVDDTGAQTQTAALFSGATAGTIQSVTFPVRFVTGTNLTYSTTTANSPKYKIIARAITQ